MINGLVKRNQLLWINRKYTFSLGYTTCFAIEAFTLRQILAWNQYRPAKKRLTLRWRCLHPRQRFPRTRLSKGPNAMFYYDLICRDIGEHIDGTCSTLGAKRVKVNSERGRWGWVEQRRKSVCSNHIARWSTIHVSYLSHECSAFSFPENYNLGWSISLRLIVLNRKHSCEVSWLGPT